MREGVKRRGSEREHYPKKQYNLVCSSIWSKDCNVYSTFSQQNPSVVLLSQLCLSTSSNLNISRACVWAADLLAESRLIYKWFYFCCQWWYGTARWPHQYRHSPLVLSRADTLTIQCHKSIPGLIPWGYLLILPVVLSHCPASPSALTPLSHGPVPTCSLRWPANENRNL